MRKLKITIEEPNDPKYFPRTNAYMTVYGLHDCWALYIADSKKPEIRIVRQGSFLRTAYLLGHELGHYIIDVVLGKAGFNVHTFYDKIERKLIKWQNIE